VRLKHIKKQSNRQVYFDELCFNKHIFNEEKDFNKKMFFLSFGEFGCETLIPTFLIPRIITNFPEYRKIVIGWNNREYFYRDLCDEFWELDSSQMMLKDNSQAFENTSIEIASLQKRLNPLGVVLSGTKIGKLCVKAKCKKCLFEFEIDRGDVYCAKCYSENIEKSLFQGAKQYKKYSAPLPEISSEMKDFANNFVPDNTVALFARNRKTYKRNLSIEFYDKIIDMLISLGYNVLLLGEKVSAHNLSNKKIINFMNHKLAGNLEAAFALVNRCVFSLQFFTASTRISSFLNKPFVLFESVSQIYGVGQEGIRISLATKNYNNKKLVLANFNDVLENMDRSVELTEQAIYELIQQNKADDLFLKPNDFILGLQESGIKNLW
jgi:hypothetical protein